MSIRRCITIKILSIDFDFFQNVNKNTLQFFYPDPIELPTKLSNTIWGSKYSKIFPYYKDIKAVSIDNNLFKQIQIILSKQNPYIPICIAQSHVYIYNFITEQTNTSKDKDLSVINIDLHHDCFTDNPGLDCGNWVLHLAKKYPQLSLMWLAREVSLELYGLSSYISKENTIICNNFGSIMDTKFDAIFLCRSDTWLPPHLDIYFDALVKVFAKKFSCVLCQESVVNPRNIHNIIKEYDKM